VLSYPNPKWSFEPEHGLALNHAMINDTGVFLCIGTMNNITDEKNFTVSVKGIYSEPMRIEKRLIFLNNKKLKTGIELERVGDPEDPTEGSNVTLICRILFPGIKFPGPPEWEYQINNTAVMQTINITNPPAGDKPIGNYGGYRFVTVFLVFIRRHPDRNRGRKKEARIRWIHTKFLREQTGTV
jgi:hypothetical protein